MRGNRVLIGFLLLVAVVLLNLPLPARVRLRMAARDGTAPAQTALGLLAGQAWEAAAFLMRAGHALRDRERLIDEVARLRFEVDRLSALDAENRDLKRMLAYRERSPDHLLLARAVSRGGTSGWWRTVRLNRGRLHGVAVNQAVMTADGLIGRVSSVAEKTCDVLLITDPSSRVSVRMAGRPVLGIARGRGVTVTGRRELEVLCGPAPLEVEYIGKHTELENGARVETSGLGGVYPAGLPLGRVVDSTLDASGLYRRLKLEPAADLGSIGYVWVVQP